MFKNYLTTAWRNIIRHKLFAAINVAGLALGISACLIIYLIAYFELSFEKFQPGKERIFRIVSDTYSSKLGEDHSSSLPFPAPFDIRDKFTGLESVAVFHNYVATVTIRNNELPVKRFAKPPRGEENRSDIIIAEPQYFDVFHYDWLAGNATALNEPNTVVLTKSKATHYFGEQSPDAMLNRTIVYNDSIRVRVVGIVKDLGPNTDFFFRDFISFNTIKASLLTRMASGSDYYSRIDEQVFVKLAKGVQPSHINALLSNLASRYNKQTKESRTNWLLQPLSTIHFNENYSDVYSRKAHMTTLYGLMAIALFILVMAIINFITLSTAQAIDRAKETGIRKICGSSTGSLIVRFMGETFVLTSLAVVLAVISVYPLLTVFRSFLPPGVGFSFFSFSTWVFLPGITALTSLLAGFYPAKVLSAAAPAIVLKGAGMQKGHRNGYFMKGLIVFQFTISIAFIIGTLIVGKQMQFMLNKDLGFTKDAIITIQTSDEYTADKKDLLAAKIRQLPEVERVSVSEGTPLAKLHFFNPLIYEGKEERGAATILEWGDAHFVPLYGIKIIAGRNLFPSDTIKEFLVSESCAKALGFTKPEDAIGKMVKTIVPPGGWVSRPIVGVLADFHSQTLHEPLKPVVLTTSKEYARALNVKLLTSGKQISHLKRALSKIETAWKQVYPNDPFDFTFFDETVANYYEKERQISWLMNVAMMVSICISCLGLFGLTTLTARRRTKEIGVRKVLGAGIGQIVLLLNKDTIKLVLIAVVVASPLAWYCMHEWLNGFAYRITIHWWIFALAGVFALLITFFTVSYQSIKAAFTNPVNALRSE
ncbi:MAG TPA: ABC transporter permease [Niastella sp.]